jgi:hypothetical protein
MKIINIPYDYYNNITQYSSLKSLICIVCVSHEFYTGTFDQIQKRLFNKLPNDQLTNIFEFCDTDTLKILKKNKKFKNIISSNPILNFKSGDLKEYVYLDYEEQMRFDQVGREYLIEQLQADENNTAIQRYNINPRHPNDDMYRRQQYNRNPRHPNDDMYRRQQYNRNLRKNNRHR